MELGPEAAEDGVSEGPGERLPVVPSEGESIGKEVMFDLREGLGGLGIEPVVEFLVMLGGGEDGGAGLGAESFFEAGQEIESDPVAGVVGVEVGGIRAKVLLEGVEIFENLLSGGIEERSGEDKIGSMRSGSVGLNSAEAGQSRAA